MRYTSKIVFWISMAFVLLLGMNGGLSLAHEDDVEGSSDHPLISRFPNSVIIYYEVKEFDEYILPLGELDGERELSESKRLAGKVTRIQYRAPKDRSTFEIYHSYESALKDSGFEILLSGTQEELGWFWTRKLYLRDVNPLHFDGNIVISEDDFRYLSAKLTDEQENTGDVYVSLCVSLYHRAEGPGIQLDVIETKPMEEELITVEANALAKEMSERGAVAIQDIHFDTGKAQIKPESEPVLEEIAKLLSQEPDLLLYVVGHTDNQGAFEYNMDLSRRRAKAVVEALVTDYNIDGERLESHGVGPLAPTTTNETEEGRTQNRRVELVVR